MEKSINISYKQLAISSLSEQEQELVEQAKKASKKAYAPYSKFNVGAALKLGNGQTVVGNNQENIAYPSGLCAERVALFNAASNHPNEPIEVIAVYASSDNFEFKDIVKPCGACRQVMCEYEIKQSSNIKVILVNETEAIVIDKAIDLLPFIFDATGLKSS